MNTNICKLTELKPNQSGTVHSFLGDNHHLHSRLRELGFTKGCWVTYIRRAPLGDPIELAIYESHIAIRKIDAMNILIELNI